MRFPQRPTRQQPPSPVRPAWHSARRTTSKVFNLKRQHRSVMIERGGFITILRPTLMRCLRKQDWQMRLANRILSFAQTSFLWVTHPRRRTMDPCADFRTIPDSSSVIPALPALTTAFRDLGRNNGAKGNVGYLGYVTNLWWLRY